MNNEKRVNEVLRENSSPPTNKIVGGETAIICPA